jgi:Sugar (and other) transporter
MTERSSSSIDTLIRHSAVEDSPLTPFLKRLTVYSSGGPFLDGYVLVIIGVALIQLEPHLALDAFWTGLIGASALVGLLLGGAVFGYVTDLTGRQLMYQIDLVAIIGFSVAQMFVANAWQLLLLRFLTGIAVGADYPIATSLLAEFSPRRYRGTLLGLLICAWYVGAVAASFVGYALLATGPDAWRWMLGSAAAPALLLVLGRWNTPESPRWLISKGRCDKALEIVRTVWGPAATLADLQESDPQPTSYWKIFAPGYLERTTLCDLHVWTADSGRVQPWPGEHVDRRVCAHQRLLPDRLHPSIALHEHARPTADDRLEFFLHDGGATTPRRVPERSGMVHPVLFPGVCVLLRRTQRPLLDLSQRAVPDRRTRHGRWRRHGHQPHRGGHRYVFVTVRAQNLWDWGDDAHQWGVDISGFHCLRVVGPGNQGAVAA